MHLMLNFLVGIAFTWPQLHKVHFLSEGDSMRWERPKDEEKFCNADVNHHCADRNTQVQI